MTVLLGLQIASNSQTFKQTDSKTQPRNEKLKGQLGKLV